VERAPDLERLAKERLRLRECIPILQKQGEVFETLGRRIVSRSVQLLSYREPAAKQRVRLVETVLLHEHLSQLIHRFGHRGVVAAVQGAPFRERLAKLARGL